MSTEKGTVRAICVFMFSKISITVHHYLQKNIDISWCNVVVSDIHATLKVMTKDNACLKQPEVTWAWLSASRTQIPQEDFPHSRCFISFPLHVV